MLTRFSPDSNPPQPRMTGRGRATAAHVPRHMLAILLLLALPLAAQSPGMPGQSAQDSGGLVPQNPDGPGGAGIDAQMEARRITLMNQQRQQQMIAAADKLLKLAQELNDDADSGQTVLSPAERMQKAAEIEKLARNVREKMTYAIGAAPELQGPFSAWQR